MFKKYGDGEIIKVYKEAVQADAEKVKKDKIKKQKKIEESNETND